jgi:O-antigen ligase
VRWAFYLFAFSMPIEYPTPLPTQIHTVTAVVFLMAASLQPSVCLRRPRAAVWWLAAYLWVYLALSVFSEHPTESLKLLTHSVLAALLLWVSSNLMRDESAARGALIGFSIGCIVLAVFELSGVGLSAIDPRDIARVTVFGQDPNFTGGNMALALVAIVALLSAAAPARSGIVVGGVVGALLVNSLLTAGSRGALLSVATGLLAFAIGGSTPRTVMKHVAIALLVAGALVWAVFRFEPTRQRVVATFATGNLAGRERIYPEAWRMIVEKPVLGWGPVDARYELRLRMARWEPRQVRISPLQRDAHNLVLETLMASGIVGGIPFLICVGVCASAAWHGRAGPHGAASFALVATVLVLSMSTNWSMSKQLWLVLGYGLASARPGEL